MDLFSILNLIGGLALFLFGMDYMGNRLTSWSGSSLKTILGSLTSNRFKGVALGAAVTAIIQSSSGTTVMVVGLVNSGIMALKEAISVIMGANIGTTITAWILSLTGIESSNVFVRLLKPTSFAPILAIIGVFMLLFIHHDRRRNLAGIFVGFAILIFGMNVMSGAMAPLADNPRFQMLFLNFSNPVLGIIAGAVLTAVLQSSSASVGILQALSITGLVPMTAAIPIILGQNIGTCFTAAISSIGAQRNAKRAAVVHFLFNAIGTSVFIVLVYSANALFDLPFMSYTTTPVMIAIAHTIFNFTNTAVLVNFIPVLERLAYLFIPETEEEREAKFDPFQILDDRLLDTPTIALEQCQTLSNDMFVLSRDLVHESQKLFRKYKSSKFKKMKRQEAKVDSYEDALGSYMLKLSALKLSAKANDQLTIMLHAIGDFERIADHGWKMVLAAKELHDKDIHFSTYAFSELGVQIEALNAILDITYDAFSNNDIEKAKQVEPLEETIDVLNNQLKLRHVRRLKAGICSIDLGFIWSDLLNAIERISDHCSNIAVHMLEVEDKQVGAHEYLHQVKKKSNVEFQKQVDHNLAIYSLPEQPENYLWSEILETDGSPEMITEKNDLKKPLVTNTEM